MLLFESFYIISNYDFTWNRDNNTVIKYKFDFKLTYQSSAYNMYSSMGGLANNGIT